MGLKLAYRGAPNRLSPTERQAIIDWLQRKNYWNLQALQGHLIQEYGVQFKSKQSYYALFAQAGIHWKKMQKHNPKADPDLGEKKTRNHCMAGSSS